MLYKGNDTENAFLRQQDDKIQRGKVRLITDKR